MTTDLKKALLKYNLNYQEYKEYTKEIRAINTIYPMNIRNCYKENNLVKYIANYKKDKLNNNLRKYILNI